MSVPCRVDLEGKIAVVTGGGGVLCSRMALALADCGAAVAVADLRRQPAEEVAAQIVKRGGTAIGVACDVLDRRSIEKAHAKVRRELGPVDILINGAGGNHPGGTTSGEYLTAGELRKKAGDAVSFYDLDAEDIRFVFNLNFLGALLPSQVFTIDMAGRGCGVVLNVSSMNAFRPLTRIPAYSAAKAAVSNFTQWLAVHLSKVGVRVNAIAPGFFLTGQNRALLIRGRNRPTPRAAKILAHTPMGRFGLPSELIGTVLWLVSDEASGFVTGIVVPVDGGFSAYSGV